MNKLIAFLLLLGWTPNQLNADELVNRNTFFEHVLGMPEDEFQKDDDAKKAAIVWNNAEKTFYIKNQNTGQQFRAGKFETHSIADLRKETEALPKPNTGKFNVIEAINPPGKPYYKHVEIGANQADPNNNDAVFQVASNFNALELLGVNDKMSGLQDYVGDLTQGPFASISAAPGLILRHYYMFHNPLTGPEEWQQYPVLGKLWQKSDAYRQINLLENTDIPVENSYVNFNRRKPEDVSNYDPANMQIAWHGNMQVTSGLMPNFKLHTQLDRTDQFINQVFTAAVAFDKTNWAFLKNNNIKAQEIAQTVLDGSYEGTIRAAALHGKKKVFLSRIGAGVFNNKLEWLANAIEKMKNFIVQSGLEVTLIIFDGNNPPMGAPEFRVRMLKLVKDTGGTYTQYSPAHPEGQILTEKGEVETPEQSPLDEAAELIKAQLAIKPLLPFAEAIQILRDKKIYFASFQDAWNFFDQKTYFRLGRDFENRKKLIETLIRSPELDDLKSALNNLTSALTDITGAIK